MPENARRNHDNDNDNDRRSRPEEQMTHTETPSPGRARHPRTRRLLTIALTLLATLVPLGAFTATSTAATTPWWRLTSRMIPTHLTPGGEATIVVQAVNLGNASTSGRYTFTDQLPAGLKLVSSHYFAPGPPVLELPSHSDLGPSGPLGSLEFCKAGPAQLSCSIESPLLGSEEEDLLPALNPYDYLEMTLTVKDEGAAPGALNELNITGGATSQKLTRPVTISSAPAGFGVEPEGFSLLPEEEGGEADTHAGTHPYQLTNTLTFNRDSAETLKPPALPRNLAFKLPPGMIGSATAVPQCSDTDFANIVAGGQANTCKADTALGVAVVTASTFPGREEHFTVPVFNLVPAAGEPARFGFEVLRSPVILDTALRSGEGEDYGVTVKVSNITQLVNFISATTVFWGAPAAISHNSARGWGCLLGGKFIKEREEIREEEIAESGVARLPKLTCETSTEEQPAAFLTLPANCEAPFDPSVQGESWPRKADPEAPAEPVTFPPVTYRLQDSLGDPLSLTGCNQLSFFPSFEALPTAHTASSPTGLNVNLNFDDEGLTSAGSAAESQMRDTVVKLPEGLTINPSAGVGLAGCTRADYARETLESAHGAGCPGNSELGTVEIQSPLIPQTVHGNVYVAQPYENPFSEPGHPNGSLVALYIVAKNPENGILIRLAGKVDRNPTTGQLTTTFENNPQLPFSHFNFHFREGQQAPLITPPTCGSYNTEAVMTPWANPLSPLTESSAFTVTEGSGGGACPAGIPPFAPQIAAGTQSNSAGAFSPFELKLTRTDSEGEIATFSTNLPEGMAGILTGIPFCPEPDIALARTKTGAEEQANPSCPAASLLGHSLVGTGVGAVLAYTPGSLYLAGPYNGDPFSLVSVTSALVGPFDLGTVVVRFGLRIDPRTAQVSVDPTASEPIPHIIDGIVTHVRDIRVSIDRPNFTFNPTSCEPMSISSTLGSTAGQSATTSSRYQAASCASLKFEPKVTVTTLGKASKANGQALTFKIAYPKGALGTNSWFNEAKFTIPKQLPARLTTIQQACLAATFENNRPACPPHSIIGHAVVHTPVLPVPLEGPVYFVSYGGAAFPDAVLVLKGYGITVELFGKTHIDGKTGVTTATFTGTPDVPFESIEVNLPTGPYSEFGSNLKGSYDFCGRKLVMPTLFKAQNGLEINQNTAVQVTGCPKGKTKAQKLAAALKACHKKHGKKRASCEKAARKAYGAKVAKKSKTKTHR